jgi:predicted Zn-dependent protease
MAPPRAPRQRLKEENSNVPSPLAPPETVLATLQEVLETSPADFTEIAWVEKRRRLVKSSFRGTPPPEGTEGTTFVRVQEGGRIGLHRTDTKGAMHLSAAVRFALALARSRPVSPALRSVEAAPPGAVAEAALFDPLLAEISLAEAKDRLRSVLDREERARLQITEGQVLVVNSQGLRCRTRTTTAVLFITSGRGVEAGTAYSCSRTLDGLKLSETLATARQRRTASPAVAFPDDLRGLPLVFSPEAATVLLEELAALTIQSRGSGPTFMESHGGQPLFGKALDLIDDATDPLGLPFPFDLKGALRRPLWILRGGVVQPLPSMPLEQADRFASLAAGGGEVRFSNLILRAGDSPQESLLRKAEGGLWIGSLNQRSYCDPLPRTCRFRVRGARQIKNGDLGSPMEEGVADFDLVDLFSRLLERGEALTRRPFGDGVFGGVAAPGLLIAPTP